MLETGHIWRGNFLRSLWLGVALAAILIAYGLFRFPAAITPPNGTIRNALPVLIVLAVYALAGSLLGRRADPRILRTAGLYGLLAGAVFAGEIVLEYIILPADNSSIGAVEFGLVFVLFFVAGALAAATTTRVAAGTLAAVGSALLSSLIWLVAVLAVYYVFYGTPEQTQVLRAEGNFEDFARSGLQDLAAWVLQDFLGAGFFHLLLAPGLAALLGTLGGLAGKGLARLFAKPGPR